MYELSLKADFAASHFLRGYKGKCESLHGHTWKVEVVLKGKKLDKIGMLMDFKDVKKDLNDILSKLDHAHLNDTAPFKKKNPTTENISKYIFDELSKKCKPLKVKQVTVWESENASATYRRNKI